VVENVLVQERQEVFEQVVTVLVAKLLQSATGEFSLSRRRETAFTACGYFCFRATFTKPGKLGGCSNRGFEEVSSIHGGLRFNAGPSKQNVGGEAYHDVQTSIG
jgi:hypothetical protein